MFLDEFYVVARQVKHRVVSYTAEQYRLKKKKKGECERELLGN